MTDTSEILFTTNKNITKKVGYINEDCNVLQNNNNDIQVIYLDVFFTVLFIWAIIWSLKSENE
jgi:hypothetical protein